jgi:heme A synthase
VNAVKNDPDLLLALHQVLFRAVLLIAVVLAVWAFVVFFRKGTLSPGYRSSLILAEVLFIIQGSIGLGLLITGHHLRDRLHILYGVLLVISVPVGLAYAGGRDRRREALVLGVACLFMAGVAIRALTTSAP